MFLPNVQKLLIMSKSKKMAKAKRTAPPVTSSDLTLTNNNGILIMNVSPNAQWAGIQKFVDMSTNEGAIALWEAQRNYTTPPGENIATMAQVQGAGFYRGWTSDFGNGDIHLSNVIQVS